MNNLHKFSIIFLNMVQYLSILIQVYKINNLFVVFFTTALANWNFSISVLMLNFFHILSLVSQFVILFYFLFKIILIFPFQLEYRLNSKNSFLNFFKRLFNIIWILVLIVLKGFWKVRNRYKILKLLFSLHFLIKWISSHITNSSNSFDNKWKF